MDFSDAKATFGLSAVGTPTSTNASGTLLLGSYSQDTQLTTADIAYSVRGIMADAGFSLSWPSGIATPGASFVSGNAQVETATIVAASGCTSNGTMALIVTAAGMTGSPKTVNVALTTTEHTTASLIAAAARTALAADTAVAARFTVGGTGDLISLTRLPTATYTVGTGTLNLYAANDATLNIAIPSGLGVTAAGTSNKTTAGVFTSGCKIYDGDGNDLEGVTLLEGTYLLGIKIELPATNTDNVTIYDLSNQITITPGTILQMSGDPTSGGIYMGNSIDFSTTTGPIDITVTVIAQS